MFRFANKTMKPADKQMMMAGMTNVIPESSMTKLMKRGENCNFTDIISLGVALLQDASKALVDFIKRHTIGKNINSTSLFVYRFT